MPMAIGCAVFCRTPPHETWHCYLLGLFQFSERHWGIEFLSILGLHAPSTPKAMFDRSMIAKRRNGNCKRNVTIPSTDERLYPKLDQSDGKTTPKWSHLDPKWHQTYPKTDPKPAPQRNQPDQTIPKRRIGQMRASSPLSGNCVCEPIQPQLTAVGLNTLHCNTCEHDEKQNFVLKQTCIFHSGGRW